jgi:hypothetical protein
MLISVISFIQREMCDWGGGGGTLLLFFGIGGGGGTDNFVVFTIDFVYVSVVLFYCISDSRSIVYIIFYYFTTRPASYIYRPLSPLPWLEVLDAEPLIFFNLVNYLKIKPCD